MIDVAGARTTAASEILRDNVATRDAESVARLRAAGAIVLGKLNTHEFAYGALTTSPHFGPARNPWSPDRVCGGSSGGSGAAVAADLAAGTLGTDTAGSIRIPACFCGVTGLRPSTRPRPERWRRARLLDVRHGRPDREERGGLQPAARGARARVPAGPGAASAGLRIGVVEELFERAEPEIADCVRQAVDELRSLGAEV